MNKKLGIYIHIPFCTQKCLYCDFCSFTSKNTDEISRYAAALAAQLTLWREGCAGYNVDSIYFGGGTPTLLSLSDFDLIFDCLHKNFTIADGAEISAECNPATAGRAYLAAIRSLGVNRLSIGAQSLRNDELMKLGRIHTREDFIKCFTDARAAGYNNISADLIYGIPGQTTDSFLESLRELSGLSPEHLSAYGLKIEEGTPFADISSTLDLPGEEEVAEMYERCVKLAGGLGLKQYEISNFAKAGYECRHNLKYWNCEEYLGIGLAAHSYFAGQRFACHRDMARYLGGDFVDPDSRVTPGKDECECEYVMLRMRLNAGVTSRDYAEIFGGDLLAGYAERIAPYVKSGHMLADGLGLRFTVRGMLLSNYILSSILDL